MAKMTRKQKKEEEARIIAEMEAALKEADIADGLIDAEPTETPLQDETPERTKGYFDRTTPDEIHCKRCKTLMKNGVCPTCGFKMYVPMDEKKRNKIRLIVAIVCIAAFLVLFVVGQATKG